MKRSRSYVRVIAVNSIIAATALILAQHASQAKESAAPEQLLPAEIVVAPPLQTLHVGERLKYQARWMGIPVGWGAVEVREIVDIDGHRAFHLIGEAHSNVWLSKFYPLHDVTHSYLDVQDLHPLRFEKSQHEGHYRSEEVVTFDQVKGVARYESFVNRQIKEYLHEAVKYTQIPPHTQDPLSAFFVLRLQPVEIGTPLFVDIYSDEKYFHTEIKILKTFSMELRRRGVFDVIQIEPIARFKGLLVKRGKVDMYLTTDSHRVPLFIQLWTPWGLVTGTIDPETAAQLQADRRRRSPTEGG